jgi:hypothetical protein
MTYLLINNVFSVTESIPATERLLVGSAATVKNWEYTPLVCGEI